jgi:hypothetical protein
MKARKTPTKPTTGEASWHKRIAQQGRMMVTRSSTRATTYSLLDGTIVPSDIAQRLIHKGLLKGQRDGLFGDVQSYEVLRP